MNKSNTIVLFDVDGTLTKPRNAATAEMKAVLKALREKVTTGVVGGSDIVKIKEQLGETLIDDFDYVFGENGLTAYHLGKVIGTESIKTALGEENLKRFINFVLGYLATVDIPVKRGTFIEFRNGMLNVSPIGRNCSQQERDDFEKYDKVHQVRAKMVSALKAQFPELGLRYSIGGQISFDVFPEGWDKTFCLRYLPQFENVFFFGDKTEQGGNDFEIYTKLQPKSFSVTSPEYTASLLKEKFGI